MKFKKKPVVIEAIQFDGSAESARMITMWSGQVCVGSPGGALTIKTLEGEMKANPGDWIIKGVKDEFYPCKPDVFEQTYEPI